MNKKTYICIIGIRISLLLIMLIIFALPLFYVNYPSYVHRGTAHPGGTLVATMYNYIYSSGSGNVSINYPKQSSWAHFGLLVFFVFDLIIEVVGCIKLCNTNKKVINKPFGAGTFILNIVCGLVPLILGFLVVFSQVGASVSLAPLKTSQVLGIGGVLLILDCIGISILAFTEIIVLFLHND